MSIKEEDETLPYTIACTGRAQLLVRAAGGQQNARILWVWDTPLIEGDDSSRPGHAYVLSDGSVYNTYPRYPSLSSEELWNCGEDITGEFFPE